MRKKSTLIYPELSYNMNNTYFILRHGQTIFQTKNKEFMYPWPETAPVKLTERGKRQIKKSAKLLKTKGIDVIYSSDVFRTRQTAGIAAKELGLKVIFDTRLRDINLGIYHGGKKEEFYRDFQRDNPKRFSKRPKGGESWNDLKRRMKNFIRNVDKKYENKNILIISHGDPLWLLEKAVVKGLSNQELLGEISLKKKYIQPGEVRKLYEPR